ncbi:UBA domain-containing protein [Granulicella tundricola]|uniref:Uncharacterized protein n=1 Tax=Granulicella tundricola (strain ATCC BAA-1859 / DSM 23138 / MP5ACTX9) TaxID=1198114 RepID=E8X0R3_GRATM|nr:hypothetical protein [Granulicella tundricola]ADW69014.1 hypothetical protein AciX9_1968 [Granulicella tundricola MP5ACTX9]
MSWWVTATLELGLSSEQFYDLTPRQFQALCKRYQNNRETVRNHTELMFGQLTSWVVNTGFRSYFEKFQIPAHFMPSLLALKQAPTKQPNTRMTKAKRAAVVDTIRMMFPAQR